jgi:transposase, IS5 family
VISNEHDITETAKLIREDDAVVYGDSGYLGIEKREDIKSDNNFQQVDFRINKRPSQSKIAAHYMGTLWDK